jgi:opacity protein-like surface antigen
MKRLMIFILLGISASAFAQDQKFVFGPSWKAGISQILFQKTDTIPDHSLLNRVNFSFQAGGFAFYNFTQRSSVGLELLYWMQNGKVKDTYSFTDANSQVVSETDVYTATVSYVTIPIFYQYSLSDIILLLGVQGGYAFDQSGKIQATTITNGNTETGDKTSIEPDLENLDIGFKAGILYKITDNFTAGVEYYNGRVNLSKNNTDPYSSHNQYFYGSFRYNILTGKRQQIYYN